MARNENASYELSDSRRSPINGISTIDLAFDDFATLDAFVRATNSTEIAVKRGYSFQFRDTGGWCPLGVVGTWYRCLLVRYQNPVDRTYGVEGTVILSTGAYFVWIGEITGISTFTVEWTTLKDDGLIKAQLPRRTGVLNGHCVAGDSGWTALTSHASGDLSKQWRLQMDNDGQPRQYKTTDGGSTWSVVGTIYAAQQNNYFCDVYYADSSATDVSFSGTIIFNSVRKNNGGCYSTSTGMFTCPVTGLYFASFDYYTNNSSVSQRPCIMIGGVRHMINGGYGGSISTMAYCTAGQTIYVCAMNSNFPVSLYPASGHNCFNVVLVKATA